MKDHISNTRSHEGRVITGGRSSSTGGLKQGDGRTMVTWRMKAVVPKIRFEKRQQDMQVLATPQNKKLNDIT